MRESDSIKIELTYTNVRELLEVIDNLETSSEAPCSVNQQILAATSFLCDILDKVGEKVSISEIQDDMIAEARREQEEDWKLAERQLRAVGF